MLLRGSKAGGSILNKHYTVNAFGMQVFNITNLITAAARKIANRRFINTASQGSVLKGNVNVPVVSF